MQPAGSVASSAAGPSATTSPWRSTTARSAMTGRPARAARRAARRCPARRRPADRRRPAARRSPARGRGSSRRPAAAGVGGERAGHGEHLLLAARQQPGPPVRAAGRAPGSTATASSRRCAGRAAPSRRFSRDREPGEQRPVLGHEAEAPPGVAVRRPRQSTGSPEHRTAPPSGRSRPAIVSSVVVLPAPFGPEQRHDLARVDGAVDRSRTTARPAVAGVAGRRSRAARHRPRPRPR